MAFRDHSPLLYLVLRETEHSYCRPEQDPLDSLLARAPVEVFDEQDVPATLDHPRVWLLDSAQSRQLHACLVLTLPYRFKNRGLDEAACVSRRRLRAVLMPLLVFRRVSSSCCYNATCPLLFRARQPQ